MAEHELLRRQRAQVQLQVYQVAWANLKVRLQSGKTSWGKNELQSLMAECLEDALNEGT